MDQTLRRSLVSAVIGFGVGASLVVHVLRAGHCPDLPGFGSRTACTPGEVVGGGLASFTLVTLALTLLVAVLALRGDGPARRAGLGDTFLAIGSIVAMVQAATLAVTGTPVALAYGLLVLALSLIAVRRAASASRHDREVATVVAMLLTMVAVVWVAVRPEALLLGLPVTVLWVLGALAYLDGARNAGADTWRRRAPLPTAVDR